MKNDGIIKTHVQKYVKNTIFYIFVIRTFKKQRNQTQYFRAQRRRIATCYGIMA